MMPYFISVYCDQLERTYKDKYDALVNRERNASERLQQQTEAS